jgi:hypothetical protein
MTIDTIKKHKAFAIYGAQVVAYGAYTAIKHLCGGTPECFVVSELDGNPEEIDGVAVRRLDGCGLPRDTLVVVAVTELLQAEILAALGARGYGKVLALGAREEHALMSAYFTGIGLFPPLRGASSAVKPCDVGVYAAKHVGDKLLRAAPVLADWETPIQVGAALTDERIAEARDDSGENISVENARYAETTAVYWLWKNANHDYKGIAHYRRRLALTDAQINELSKGEADAVLSLPYVCLPDMLSQHKRFVGEAVARAMSESLKALHPDRCDAYARVLHGRYHYAYNLVLAKDTVYDEYCSWLFGILAHMESAADKAPEIKTTRALAYAAEALTSLYFLHNADKLNIFHAERRIYT